MTIAIPEKGAVFKATDSPIMYLVWDVEPDDAVEPGGYRVQLLSEQKAHQGADPVWMTDVEFEALVAAEGLQLVAKSPKDDA